MKKEWKKANKNIKFCSENNFPFNMRFQQKEVTLIRRIQLEGLK